MIGARRAAILTENAADYSRLMGRGENGRCVER